MCKIDRISIREVFPLDSRHPMSPLNAFHQYSEQRRARCREMWAKVGCMPFECDTNVSKWNRSRSAYIKQTNVSRNLVAAVSGVLVRRMQYKCNSPHGGFTFRMMTQLSIDAGRLRK
jgi:hypothetical protein